MDKKVVAIMEKRLVQKQKRVHRVEENELLCVLEPEAVVIFYYVVGFVATLAVLLKDESELPAIAAGYEHSPLERALTKRFISEPLESIPSQSDIHPFICQIIGGESVQGFCNDCLAIL